MRMFEIVLVLEKTVVAAEGLGVFDPPACWPWLSQHPKVVAAGDQLTHPDNLPVSQHWLTLHANGVYRNEWAEQVTAKAVEVSRQRAQVVNG